MRDERGGASASALNMIGAMGLFREGNPGVVEPNSPLLFLLTAVLFFPARFSVSTAGGAQSVRVDGKPKGGLGAKEANVTWDCLRAFNNPL